LRTKKNPGGYFREIIFFKIIALKIKNNQESIYLRDPPIPTKLLPNIKTTTISLGYRHSALIDINLYVFTTGLGEGQLGLMYNDKETYFTKLPPFKTNFYEFYSNKHMNAICAACGGSITLFSIIW
jgi:hypothetical protein